MPHPNPEFLSSFDATTALDTPQTLVVSVVNAAETVALKTLRVRKHTLRHPSSETDGTLVADYTPPVPAQQADIVVSADTVYYYSAFALYEGPASSVLSGTQHSVKRLHDVALGVHAHTAAGRVWLVGRSASGYSALVFDTTRGYVESEIAFTPPEGTRCSLDVHEYPAASGQIVVFISTDSGVRGYAATGLVYSVDYTGMYKQHISAGFIVWAAGIMTGINLLDTATVVRTINPTTGALTGSTTLPAAIQSYYHDAFNGLSLSADGLAWHTADNRRIMRFDPIGGDLEAYSPTRTVPTRFCEIDEGGGTLRLFIYDPENTSTLHKYTEPVADINLTEAVDSDSSVLTLLHCETAPASVIPDSSGHANTGTLVAPAALNAGGKFGNGVLCGATGYVNCNTVAADINTAVGSMDMWIRTTDLAALVGRYIVGATDGGGSNRIQVWITNGTVQGRRTQGGATVTCTSAAVIADTAWHHVYYEWNTGTGLHRVYLDGVAGVAQAGVVAIPAMSSCLWGCSAMGALHWQQYIDQLRISSAARTAYTNYDLWRRAGDSYCRAGGDRTTGFQYRSQLPTARFVAERSLTEDTDRSISGPDLILPSTNETVRRGWPTTEMGHLARLLRLIGATVDRAGDSRDYLLPADVKTCTPAVVEALIPLLDIASLAEIQNPRSTEQYPLDKQRVYLGLLPWINPRIGIISALVALCHYYGFRTKYTVTHPRYHWDSGIHLDSGMPFDSSHPIACSINLNLDLYDNDNLLLSQTDGVTNIPVPGTFRFTSAAGNFTTAGIRVGDMLRLMDSTDLGDYAVLQVVDAHTIDVTTTWPVSGNVGISYRIIPSVPTADPMAGYVYREVFRFAASNIKIV